MKLGQKLKHKYTGLTGVYSGESTPGYVYMRRKINGKWRSQSVPRSAVVVVAENPKPQWTPQSRRMFSQEIVTMAAALDLSPAEVAAIREE